MRHIKIIFIGCGMLIALVVLALLVSLIGRGQQDLGTPGTPEQRRVAQACLRMLWSPLTNEFEIPPDDQRLPEAIRALHPVSVEVCPMSVVVMFKPQDGLAEYHLAPVSTKKLTGPWRLLGAGPRFNNAHKELLRIRAEETGALTLDQADKLARQLANEKAQALYNCQPFRDGPIPRLVQGRWLWEDRRGHGAGDIEGTVEFEADGAKPSVNVILLDNRDLNGFR